MRQYVLVDDILTLKHKAPCHKTQPPSSLLASSYTRLPPYDFSSLQSEQTSLTHLLLYVVMSHLYKKIK